MPILVIKLLLWGVGLIPFVILCYDAMSGNLIDPIEEITNPTGQWALRFLLLTLCISPIVYVTKYAPLIRYRRLLGLLAFFYMVLHLFIWLIDQQFTLIYISEDISKRSYIIVGLVALVCTLLLAITSNNMSMRILKKRWKQLHLLIYPIVVLVWLHFYLQSKSGLTLELGIYLSIITLLLGFRVYHYILRRV